MNPIFNGMPPNNLAQLQAAMANPYAIPQMPQQFSTPQMPFATLDQVNSLIDQRLKALQQSSVQQQPVAISQQVNSTMAKFEDLIKRALPPEAYAEFVAYSASGAQGFDKLLAGDALFPVVQLFWDAVKENAK